MAVGATVPCPIMAPGIDREIEPVVLPEFRRFPSGAERMAVRTCCRESQGDMVWIICAFVVGLMA
jgi:hypothetical protein